MLFAAFSFLMSGNIQPTNRHGVLYWGHRMVCMRYIIIVIYSLSPGLLQLYIHLPPGREHCHGDVSLAWQLPQLVLISFAEILVSVTGLELAYSQAPPDLRNLVTALWYIVQALGVLLNAAVVQIPISLVYQFFLYFVLMLLVTGLFLAINCRTNYNCLRRPPSSTSHQRQDCTPTKNHTKCQ
jgi:dipeptide/tripeptide permease